MHPVPACSTTETEPANRFRILFLLVSLAIFSPTAQTADHTFPWSDDGQCTFSYEVTGLFPLADQLLVDLDIRRRVTQGFNPSKKPGNYHGADDHHLGIPYSSAIDISTRCLDHSQIRQLLSALAVRGFAAWYREDGADGWNSHNHIRAVYVTSKLKPQLRYQVINWLNGKNGLKSDQPYGFWTPSESEKFSIFLAFRQANSTE